MPKRIQTIKISSILGGQSPLAYLAGSDQFQTSLAIDPDLPKGNSASGIDTKTGGVLAPSTYTEFDGAGLSGAPMWIETNPKDTNVYVYADDGEFISYSAALTSASESVIGTPTSGVGNGMAYYNNYIYLATPTDISRYGPLDGTPSLANTVWTSTWSNTALTDTTYPIFNNVSYPNHAMHAHGDNKLYFCDFKDGQGLIHYIKTSKTTNEGDTDDGSTYNALDLPFGYMPMDLESYGQYLAIAAIQTSDTTVKQGNAKLFIWDTFSDTFVNEVDIPTPLVTALKNVNGVLYVFGGNRNNGVSVYIYSGGNTVSQVHFNSEGNSPFAGAVDSYENRLVWGSTITYPDNKACVFSRGYKDPRLPSDAIHNIMVAQSAGNSKVMSAVKYVQQASGITPRVVAGWQDSTGQGLEKFGGSNTQVSVFRGQMYNVGKPFKIHEIRIPLGQAVASNMTLTPSIRVDDDTTTYTLKTVNSTNYSNSERNIIYKRNQLRTNTTGAVGGEHNFQINLAWTGTAYLSVLLPIEIDIEILKD